MTTIYIASKTAHGKRWATLRDDIEQSHYAAQPKRNLPLQSVPEPPVRIISTWIDECGEGETTDFVDLWRRCASEAASADVTIVYREAGETLKGALLEMGIATGNNRRVILCGDFSDAGTWTAMGYEHCTSMIQALDLAQTSTVIQERQAVLAMIDQQIADCLQPMSPEAVMHTAAILRTLLINRERIANGEHVA